MKDVMEYNPGVAGDIRAVSRLFGIPQYVLRLWQRGGIIGLPVVTETGWAILSAIRQGVWDNRNVIRAMLRGLPIAERRRLVDTCDKTAIERIVYDDFLRFKLSGSGIMGDHRPVTYERYLGFLSWRHPHLFNQLTYEVFIRQRKAALAKISYAKRTGTIERLRQDMFSRINASESAGIKDE